MSGTQADCGMAASDRVRVRCIAPIPDAAELNAVRSLLREYQVGLGISLDFQDFESELANLPGDYCAPRGAILVAELDGQIVGSVALRPLQWPEIGEMKRLYVQPRGRGHGIGLRLARTLITVARDAGYARLRLDTLPTMNAALHVYDTLGFKDIPAYCHNPVRGARFLEYDLALMAPRDDGARSGPS